jgi:hypothetical protein
MLRSRAITQSRSCTNVQSEKTVISRQILEVKPREPRTSKNGYWASLGARWCHYMMGGFVWQK